MFHFSCVLLWWFNFEPDPRVPIILGRPFLRTAKTLIDLYEEKLTLRVGKDELVYYADKSEKNKDKNCVHAISIIDFSKDDPFSGSTTNTFSPSSSPVKASDNFEKFADELAPFDSLPPGNDDSTLKKDLHEENFQFTQILFSNSISELKLILKKISDFTGDIDLTFPPTLDVSSSTYSPTSRRKVLFTENADVFLVGPICMENDDSNCNKEEDNLSLGNLLT
ncbi:hypothetical protein Tco_0624864 [Tanacetum coccineum]|uniref:Reverse transcriptase domain-containing protein n=1 Tax=Tanacetum coccineum TaxID=301880 RepID=A0ABQ4WF65_9ASTR